MIQWMLAIWFPVPRPFLNPAWTSGCSQFMYCWSLACRILSITLLACDKLPQNFKQKHLLSRAVSLGQELRSTLDRDSGLEALRTCGLSTGAVTVTRGFTRTEGLPSKVAQRLAWQMSIGWLLPHWESSCTLSSSWLLPRDRSCLSQPSLGSPTQSLVTHIRSTECERDYTRGVNITRREYLGARWEAGILGSWFLHLQLFHPPCNFHSLPWSYPWLSSITLLLALKCLQHLWPFPPIFPAVLLFYPDSNNSSTPGRLLNTFTAHHFAHLLIFFIIPLDSTVHHFAPSLPYSSSSYCLKTGKKLIPCTSHPCLSSRSGWRNTQLHSLISLQIHDHKPQVGHQH